MPTICASWYHRSVRVLIVEDEPYLAEAIRDGLRLAAIAADIAGDGDTALELLSINAYDIAVLDRDIPGPSGDAELVYFPASEEAARCVLALPRFPEITVDQQVRVIQRPLVLVQVVDLVLVNVTVTDPLNRYVSGLESQHFQVWEDKVGCEEAHLRKFRHVHILQRLTSECTAALPEATIWAALTTPGLATALVMMLYWSTAAESNVRDTLGRSRP
jgi:hypothetical protein